MKPSMRFEVVLCSHNGGEFIEAQIESILKQELGIAKIHVHDFDSCDDTRRILELIRARYANIICITYHAEAPGARASFIRALKLVEPIVDNDALILLADQDDVWLPGKLGRLVEEIARCKLSPDELFLMFHDVQVVDERLQMMRPSYYTGNPFRVPRDLHPIRLLMANPVIGHTMLLSVPLVRAVVAWPDSDEYMMHDWQSVLIASRYGKLQFVPAALSLYRQHNGNVLGAYRTRHKFHSIPRLFRFVDRMILQSMSFSQAACERSATAGEIERWCGRGYRSAAMALSVAALLYGPTWQRKAIAALLFACAIMGRRENPMQKNDS